MAASDWATTSITVHADEEMGTLFRLHGLEPPHLALQSQSALTLIVTLACTDLLAMVPIQWTAFEPAADILQVIPVREVPPAPAIVLIHRAGLPLTPAATCLVDLLCKAAASRCSPEESRAPR